MAICRLTAVSAGPSTSEAFAKSSVWVMTRALLGQDATLIWPSMAMEGALNAIVGVALFLFLDRLRERA